MFSHIVGVADEAALKHATDLGIAMQLTNISRDIQEDAENARVYLPESWLRDAGLSSSQILAKEFDQRVVKVAERLLNTAEAHYRSGEQGLDLLPWQTAVAVYAARLIYAEIGYGVRQRGLAAIHSRVWTSHARKVRLAMKAIGWGIRQLPKRLLSRRKNCAINTVRRFQWDAHRF